MKDIHLIQISLEELEELISRAVRKEVEHIANSSGTKSSRAILSRQQAADLLGISRPSLDKYTTMGLITAHKIPGSKRVLYKESDLMDALEVVKVSKYKRI
jgi:excisionase family DNA binding protein